MAMDFRGRVPGATERDAGNYSNVIQYRPPDWASPARIRQSVERCRRASVPPTRLLHGFEDLGARYVSVTSWAALAKGLVLPDCSEKLHVAYMPHLTLDPPLPPASTWAMAILFSPNPSTAPDKLAMVLLGDAAFHRRVLATGISNAPLHPDST